MVNGLLHYFVYSQYAMINDNYDFQANQNQGMGGQERSRGHSDPVQRRV